MKILIIGKIVSNMSNIQEEVFGNNSTLWEVLNAQGVPELAEQQRQLKDQIDTLGVTLQRYQFDTNAEIVRINTQLITINSNITSLSDQVQLNDNLVSALQVEVDALSTQVAELSSEIGEIPSRLQAVENSVSNLSFELNSLTLRVNSIDNRLTQMITLQNNNYVQYETVYSVIEWPFWQTGYRSYEMRISGSGGYVPMNRNVVAVINGTSIAVSFGIAFRDIPPITSGSGVPAPLMQGLASANFNNTGTVLIYINRTQ